MASKSDSMFKFFYWALNRLKSSRSSWNIFQVCLLSRPTMLQCSEHIKMKLRARYLESNLQLWVSIFIRRFLRPLSPGPIFVQVSEVAFCKKIPNFIQTSWHEGSCTLRGPAKLAKFISMCLPLPVIDALAWSNLIELELDSLITWPPAIRTYATWYVCRVRSDCFIHTARYHKEDPWRYP